MLLHKYLVRGLYRGGLYLYSVETMGELRELQKALDACARMGEGVQALEFLERDSAGHYIPMN